jgi:hypothetical protein
VNLSAVSFAVEEHQPSVMCLEAQRYVDVLVRRSDSAID